MKYSNIILGCALALSVASCDNVDENERFIPLPEFKAEKKVLIEDFTGQKCINCPNAAAAVHSMQQLYGADNVISVAIHGGAFSISDTDKLPPVWGQGLANDQSKAYVAKWDVQSFPSGMVDRVKGLKEYTGWSAAVVERLQKTTPISIDMNNEYITADNKVKVTVTVKSEVAYSGNLQVWAVEDSIVSVQIQPNGAMQADYVHNHVFRTSLNGADGTAISLSKDEAKDNEYSFDITDDRWKVENMSIVAFVYDAEGVQQTAVKKIESNN